MRRAILGLALLSLALTGCSRSLKTGEIHFYRDMEVNQGLPVAVDIIYPRNWQEREQILRQVPDGEWFTSDLYHGVIKDEANVIPERRVTTVLLDRKPRRQRSMIIIANYGKPSESTEDKPRGYKFQRRLLIETEGGYDKPRKKEYIWIHDGTMERLRRRPSR